MNWTIRLLFAVTVMSFQAYTQAQGFTPTAEQIQQFKNMSPAQQQQMAEAAGIDINALMSSHQDSKQPVLSDGGDTADAKSSQQKTEAGEEDSEADDNVDDDRADPAKLPLFGRDLFQNGLDAFRPATDIPVPANYVMGPGDTLVIQLYGKENLAHSLVLNREGQIQFPQIGPVTLAGLTFSQAQKVVEQIVSEQMIGVKASVTMGALRSIRVFVLGEVERPGSFTVGSLATMTNALFVSGGITDVGSLRNIQLKRRGELITTLDLYSLLLNGDTSNDARLLPGDVIFVPPLGKTVGITGQVKRPATYEIENDATINATPMSSSDDAFGRLQAGGGGDGIAAHRAQPAHPEPPHGVADRHGARAAVPVAGAAERAPRPRGRLNLGREFRRIRNSRAPRPLVR